MSNHINEQIRKLFSKYTDLTKIRKKIHKIRKNHDLDKDDKKYIRRIRHLIRDGYSREDIKSKIINIQTPQEKAQENSQEKQGNAPEPQDNGDDNDSPMCRICYDDDNTDKTNVLCYPCKCNGSIKWIHQECLKQSIEISKSDKCAICKYKYPTKARTHNPTIIRVLLE